MQIKRTALIITSISAALILVTTYLAIFYAPFGQTSVKAADEMMADVEGLRITVAGFVAGFDSSAPHVPELPPPLGLSLADFSDYQRYLIALRDGTLDSEWWTIMPIHVGLSAQLGASLEGLVLGANISVTGRVVELLGGGFGLKIGSLDDITLGSSPGQFSILSAPIAQKIFYFHMPSAWVGYLAFFITLVMSAMFLRTRKMNYDRWAFCAAELGVLFATIAIATGPIWAKQEWGVYWRWNDTKLVTTFILWLVYIGYLMLRSSVSDSGTRARVAGVYGILGFVTVPLSLLSARVAPLLQSSHPEVIASKSGSLSMEAGITVGIAVVAFTLLFITMLIKRVAIAESEDELEELKREIGEEES